MARSRKKTLSQKIVTTATTGMPSPIRKSLGNRFVSFLIVAAVPVLLVTGVLSVDWQTGRPRLSINRERAVEVEHEAAEKIQGLRDQHVDDRTGFPKFLPQAQSQASSRPGFAPEFQLAPPASQPTPTAEQAQGPISRLKQRFEERR